MENWITIISALAAFFAALAALFTVREMQRQRRSMYRPNFALLQCSICAHRNNKGLIEISNSPLSTQSGDGFSETTIPAANVGMGSCKNVKLKWEYDILEFVRIIKHHDKEEEFEITYEHERLDIRGNTEFLLSPFHNLSNQNETEIAYVVPVTVQSTPVELRIPFAYLALYKAWLYLRLANMEKESTSDNPFEPPPPINITLQYQDIGNEQIDQKYQVVFHHEGFMPNKPDEDKWVTCMLGYAQPTSLK